MDTDGGDYPYDHLSCHLFLPAYLPRACGADVLFCACRGAFAA